MLSHIFHPYKTLKDRIVSIINTGEEKIAYLEQSCDWLPEEDCDEGDKHPAQKLK